LGFSHGFIIFIGFPKHGFRGKKKPLLPQTPEKPALPMHLCRWLKLFGPWLEERQTMAVSKTGHPGGRFVLIVCYNTDMTKN
jgi:hypothetical protein